MTRTVRLRAWVAAAVAVAGLTVVLAQPWTGSDAPKTGGRAPGPLPAQANLDAGGRELAELLAGGRTGRWHARYEITRPTGQPGEQEILEVWRDGSRARQDTFVPGGIEPYRTVGIRDGRRLVSCVQVGNARWQCRGLETPALDPDLTFDLAVGELGNRTVTSQPGEVAGIAGRCFALTGDGPDGEICVTHRGIPLRIAREGVRMEIVVLDDDVPDRVFQPPAPVR